MNKYSGTSLSHGSRHLCRDTSQNVSPKQIISIQFDLCNQDTVNKGQHFSVERYPQLRGNIINLAIKRLSTRQWKSSNTKLSNLIKYLTLFRIMNIHIKY
jgi:hypothetical protein